MDQPIIIIVGAGISGLAAADQLINKYGFKNVAILEASDRIGGRIHPVEIAPGAFAQLGAEFVHSSPNPIYEIAIQNGLISDEKRSADDLFTGLRFIDENGEDAPERLQNDYLSFVFGKLEESAKEGPESGYDCSSYGNLMDQLLQRMIDEQQEKYSERDKKILWRIQKVFRSIIEIFNSSNDWHRISLKEYTLQPGGPEAGETWISMNKLGYRVILDEMLKRVPPEKYIQLNSCVQCIRWNCDKTEPGQKNVQIELSDGRSLKADHIIVTCSLGYLKKYAGKLFDPSLPKEKSDAIAAYGFDALEKLLMIFEKPFWPDEQFVLNSIKIEDKDGTEVGTDISGMFVMISASSVHENCLIALINGRDAAFFNSMSDLQVAEAAATVIRRLFKNPSVSVPKIVRSSWHSNPLSQGGYSWSTTDADALHCQRSHLADPLMVLKGDKQVPVVLFAGEATGDSLHSTTHGAYATGVREADRLANLYTFQL